MKTKVTVYKTVKSDAKEQTIGDGEIPTARQLSKTFAAYWKSLTPEPKQDRTTKKKWR